MNRWNGRVVWTPPISTSSSARREPVERELAIVVHDDELGDQRVVVGRDPVARLDGRVDPDARPARDDPAGDRAGRRSEGSRRDPRPRSGPRSRGARGSAASSAARSIAADRGRPAAIASCSRTMSTPATSSVTPCSTWRRVLTSRNQKSRASSKRNSAVAAFRRPAARAARRPSSCRWRRSSAVRPGRRRLLDQLLVPALDRAVALAEGDDRPDASPRSWTSTWRAGRISRSR